MKEEVLKFLKDKKVVTLATIDEKGNPWVSNLYFGVDDDFNMYFMSKRDCNHSKHIERDPKIAYTVVWHNPEDYEDRIAIQATGEAYLVKDLKTIAKGAGAIFSKFDDWKIDPKDTLEKISKGGMYIIRPKYFKFWNDKILGKKTEDINF